MATVALASWPFIVMALFMALPRKHALIIGIVMGYLLLPESFSLDYAGLPPINKLSVVSASILLSLLLVPDRRLPKNDAVDRPQNRSPMLGYVVVGLMLVVLVGSLFTVMTNSDPLNFGPRWIRGLRLWDSVNMITAALVILIPYAVGRRFLAAPKDHQLLLICLTMAGLFYSLLAVFEVRFSPQLHNWLYGFRQHSFLQHIRDGDFRPMIFLRHGLWVGFFLFSTFVAAVSLYLMRENPRRKKWGLAAIWLLLVLLVSKNLGASVIALLIAAVFFLKQRLQLLLISIITIGFLTYPAIRQADVLPLDPFVAKISEFSAQRAESFQYRLNNEDILLNRAEGKPFFGWGGWGRSRVYNEFGRDLSTTDGLWIIVLGTSGWIGYVSFFGLLALPLLMLRRVRKRKEVPIQTIGLALIMTGNLIYLVPNSALSPIGWLIAGSLVGFVQFDKAKERDDTLKTEGVTDRQRPSYTRFARKKSDVLIGE